MADAIVIGGFERHALEQIERYLGNKPGEIKEKLISSSSVSSNNSSNKIDDEIESIEKKIEKYTQLLGDSIQDYKNSTDSVTRHRAGALMNALKGELGVLQLNLSILKEQQQTVEETTKKIEKQGEAVGEITKAVKDLWEYQNARYQDEKKQRQEWFEDKRNKLKELDKLEDDLYTRRQLKSQRQRERLLKLELNTTDEEGRTKANKEWEELKNKFREFKEENTVGRRIGVGTSKVFNGLTKGTNFLASDNKVSISDIGNKFANIAGNFGPWGKAAGAIAQLVAAIVETYDKVNIAASKYAREVGGGLTKMSQMKVDATSIANSISKWGGNAYKFDEILAHIAELSSKTGRVMDHMSMLDMKSLEDLTRYGINSDTINMYDSFGLSVEKIDERITDIYKKSGRHGLNAKAVTDAVNKNLRMAQQYTFAGGQRALERMAEKAVALKYNMESVARFADKVSTLEGAAQAGAGLSVLGGDFARMGNPLSMLYGGLQDPERLNEMMLNMTKNMAHWDNQLGEMRITAYNRQRLRAAAEYMGVDSNDLINQALMQGKRNKIDTEIGNGITDEDTREYIRNLAQLDENGHAYIRFSGSETPTYLKDLKPEHKERLKKESEAMEQRDKAKIGDIWQETRTIQDKLNDYIQWMKTKMFEVLLKIAGYTDEEKAKQKGLNSGNAEMFEDFSDDYANGSIDSRAIKALQHLGASGETFERFKKHELNQEDADNFIINTIKKQQDSGFTYKGNKWFDYAYTDADKYSTEEWLKKMNGNTDNKKAFGGTIHGAGTSKSDSIPAMLSDGEFVMNAKATKKHLPELQVWNNAERFFDGSPSPIRAGANQTNSMTVSNPGVSGNNQSLGIDTLKLEPISINVNGTIKLDAGNGISRNVDAKEWLFNNNVISQLMREISVAANRTLDKTLSDLHQKYPMSLRQSGMG